MSAGTTGSTTAGLVNRMVSRFLLEKDFEAYVSDPGNYPPLSSDD